MKSGILTKEDIIKSKIIEIYDEEDIEKYYSPAAYDLRLGSKHCLASDEKHEDYGPKMIDISKDDKFCLVIPPFSSALISTYENVKLPKNVVGRFNLRVSLMMNGLLFQCGTQVEPGYHGKLFGVIYNMTDNAIRLKYKEAILTIEFSYLSAEAIVPEKNLLKKTDFIDFVTKDILKGSIQSFTISLNKSQEEIVRKISNAALSAGGVKLILLTCFITIILGISLPLIITKFSYDKDDFPLVNSREIDVLKEKDYIHKKKQNVIYLERLSLLLETYKLGIKTKQDSTSISNLEKEISELIILLKENQEQNDNQ